MAHYAENRKARFNYEILEKYELNHLFLTNDSILLEHDYNFITNWKHKLGNN